MLCEMLSITRDISTGPQSAYSEMHPAVHCTRSLCQSLNNSFASTWCTLWRSITYLRYRGSPLLLCGMVLMMQSLMDTPRRSSCAMLRFSTSTPRSAAQSLTLSHITHVPKRESVSRPTVCNDACHILHVRVCACRHVSPCVCVHACAWFNAHVLQCACMFACAHARSARLDADRIVAKKQPAPPPRCSV